MSIKGFQIDGTVQRYDYTALDNKPVADATLSVSGGFADAAAVGVVAAEIEDVRIGADGTEYASAGQAVRAQVTALESAIPAVDSTLSTQGAAADAKAVGDALADVSGDSENIAYSNTNSGLLATNVQDAIDETALGVSTNTAKIGNLNQLATSEKNTLVGAINEAMTTSSIQLCTLYLYGDESEFAANINSQSKNKMNFRYAFYNPNKGKQKYGWCKLSLQGNSTLHLPKHNFNLQYYKGSNYASKDKTDYMDLAGDKHPKWTLKANYNDYSHARNVVSARLWGDIVHSRSNMRKALSDAPNHGAIDGHPVLVYINDAYYGLYTYNMSKSDWMLGIDEDAPSNCAVSATGVYAQTQWETAGLTGWELEIPDTWQTITNGDQTTTSVRDGFTALQNFVINSTDEEFISGLSDHLDIPSAIDYLIFAYCLCNADAFNKNQFLLTWDAGLTWTFTAYDMDQTFGAGFNAVSSYDRDLFATHPNALFERLLELFYDDVYARYTELRDSVMSYEYIARELEIFFGEIPSGARERDIDRWPGQSFVAISDLATMKLFVQNRLQWCDSWMARQNPDYVACTGITLNKATMSFGVLASEQLIATTTPADTSDTIIWTSSNTSVATVNDSGVVTAVANGSATITATCGDYSATCTATVLLISRGTVDYTLDGLSGATWNADSVYNKDTGALQTVTKEYCTDKFHLQNCLYQLTGGNYARLFIFDADGNYLGCSNENRPVFSARSDYLYAVKTYDLAANNLTPQLLPINNLATEGTSKIINITRFTRASQGFAYNSTIGTYFSGLASASGGVLDYSAIDWIYSDIPVFLDVSALYSSIGNSASLPHMLNIRAVSDTIEAHLYFNGANNQAKIDEYIANHPIMLVINY